MLQNVPAVIYFSWGFTVIGWILTGVGLYYVDRRNNLRAEASEIFTAIKSAEDLFFEVIRDSKKFWINPRSNEESDETFYNLIHKFKRLSGYIDLMVERDDRFNCANEFTQLRREVTGGNGESIDRPVLKGSDPKFDCIDDLATKIMRHLRTSYNEAYGRGKKLR